MPIWTKWIPAATYKNHPVMKSAFERLSKDYVQRSKDYGAKSAEPADTIIFRCARYILIDLTHFVGEVFTGVKAIPNLILPST
jgi:hypothetical protein